MFELITSAVSGGLVGLIGTTIKQWQERKERESDRAHDLAMRKLDQEDMRLEAKLALEQTEAEFAGKERLASYDNDRATYIQGIPKSGFIQALLTLVDVIRGLMRPTITGYLLIIESIIMFKLYVMMDGVEGMTTSSVATLFGQIVQSIIFLTSTAITWWFGSRPNQATK